MIDYYFIVRFSLVTPTASNSWKMAKNASDFDEYLSEILSIERLRTRIELFKSLTIPSIQGQVSSNEIDFKIHIIVATSDLMPKEIKLELELIANDQTNIKILYVPHTQPLFMKMTNEYILNTSRQGARLVTIRIDDDDGLSLNYLASTIPYINFCKDNFCLSFTSGFVVEYKNKVFLDARKYTFPRIALGLAYICTRDSYKNIYELGSHIEVDRVATCFNVVSPDYFFWTRHGFSDSGGLTDNQKMLIKTIDINEVITALGYGGTKIEKFISR